jgi:phage/plasmid primase-like uncharacterized protein
MPQPATKPDQIKQLRSAKNLKGCIRCIEARQGGTLDGVDSMAASEKARQTNLEIGGATLLAVTGRSASWSQWGGM